MSVCCSNGHLECLKYAHEMDVLGMNILVLLLPQMVTSRLNTRTKTSVHGIDILVLVLLQMVTSSVGNMRETGVLEMKVLVLMLPIMVKHSHMSGSKT